MSQPIRVVFFDAAETLFHVNGSVAEIYLRHAVQFGFQPKPDSIGSITQAFSRAFHDAPPPVFAATEPAQIKQSERLWWFDIVHNVFYRVGMFERFDEFFDQVFDVFADPDSWRLFPETCCRRLTQLEARDSSWASFPILIRDCFRVAGVGHRRYLRHDDYLQSGPCRETVAQDFSAGVGEACRRSGGGPACRRQCEGRCGRRDEGRASEPCLLARQGSRRQPTFRRYGIR